jgi:transposase
MARGTNRADLVLPESHRQMLTELSGSRAAPAREVERAKILLRYAEGISISDIQRQVGISRPTIYKCIDKALAAGVPVGLKDTFHRPKEPEILADAKAWVVSLACTKPKDHGLVAELWTLSALMRSPACKRSA